MSLSWLRRLPVLVEQVRETLKVKYPDLLMVEEEGVLYIRGVFPVIFEEETLDRYKIEIEFPHDYPKSQPKVRETGSRIPKIPDRHINASDKDACLFVEEDWLVRAGPEPTFLEFLDGPVRNFFIGQSLVEAGKPWPFGELPHGKEGALETYGEWFDTKDEGAISQYLECLSRGGLKGHWDCPCGSGKRIRHCHFDQLKKLRNQIPKRIAQKAFGRLKRL